MSGSQKKSLLLAATALLAPLGAQSAQAQTLTLSTDTTVTTSNSGTNGANGGADAFGGDGTNSIDIDTANVDVTVNGGLNIFGGNGGDGGTDASNDGGNDGGDGGFGVNMFGGNTQTLTVSSGATIRGGDGGTGSAGAHNNAGDVAGGNGGSGGTAIEALNAGSTVTLNSATVTGGAGGNGGAASDDPADATNTALGGLYGSGGYGIFVDNSTGITLNINGASTVTGGASGDWGVSLANGGAQVGGDGSEAIRWQGLNGAINIASGSTVQGGAGGAGVQGGNTGSAGSGIWLGNASSGTTLINAGSILSGNDTAGSNNAALFVESGGTVDTITNSGAIGAASGHNSSAVRNLGTITNFTNSSGGFIRNNSDLTYLNSTMNVSATITNFVNAGSIINSGAGVAIEANSAITNFSNSGTIQGGDTGVGNGAFTGALWIGNSGFDNTLTNSGTFTSNAGADQGTINLDVDMGAGGFNISGGGSVLNTGAGYGLNVSQAQTGTVFIVDQTIDGVQFDVDNEALDIRASTINRGIAFAGGANLLEFRGAGTTTLGANSGITTPGGGTVDVTIANNATVVSNAALTSGAINNVTMSSGTSLTLNNSLSMAGTLYASGDVTINSGATVSTSAVTAIDAIGSSLTIANGATVSGQQAVVLETSATLNNSGTISGSIRGISVVGGSPYTIINTGTIASGNRALYVVSGSGTLTNSGSITGIVEATGGSDSIVNSGSMNGNVLLGGAADTLELQAGSTITGNVRGGAGTDILRFGGASNASFDLSLLGTGLQYDEFETLEKTGASTWDFTGTSTFNGIFDIFAGNVTFNGVGNNISPIVHTGATLGGNATLDSLDVYGTVAPGNSIGTINLNGSVNFASGSTYVVEVAPNGTSDQIIAAGNANIAGGTVQIVPTAGSGYVANTQYTIITASNGVVGTFDTLAPLPLPLVTGVLTYDANNVYFLLQQIQGFNFVAITPNQQSVADAFDTIQTNATGSPELNNAINTLAAQTTSDILAGLDDLAGQSAADGLRGLNDAGANFHRFVAASTSNQNEDQPLWFGLYGQNGGQNGTSELFGSDSEELGGAVGFNLPLGGGWRGGAALGFSSNEFESSGQNDNIATDTVHLAAYARGALHGFDLSGEASFGFASLESAREIAFLSQTASGSADAQLVGLAIDAAYPFAFGQTLTVSPFLTLERFSIDRDGYTESGAPGVNQIHGDASDDATFATVGARFSANPGSLLLRGYLGVRNALDSDASGFTAAFDGDPTTTFSVTGLERPDTLGLFGLEAEWRLGDGANLRVGYDGAFGDGADSQALRASMDMRF